MNITTINDLLQFEEIETNLDGGSIDQLYLHYPELDIRIPLSLDACFISVQELEEELERVTDYLRWVIDDYNAGRGDADFPDKPFYDLPEDRSYGVSIFGVGFGGIKDGLGKDSISMHLMSTYFSDANRMPFPEGIRVDIPLHNEKELREALLLLDAHMIKLADHIHEYGWHPSAHKPR